MGALIPSLALPFFLQIINFREPVTLDFLDAELEDENKEEVRADRGQLLGHRLTPSSAVAKSTRPLQSALGSLSSSGSWHSSHGATVGTGAGSLSPGCQHDELLTPAPHRCLAGLCGPHCLPCVLQIRRSMIDGNDGQRFIKTLIKSLDEVNAAGEGGHSWKCRCAEHPEAAVGARGSVWHRAGSQGSVSPCQQSPGTAQA